MRFRSFYNVLWILMSLLLMQCASQSMPTGGPKDETPPKLISTFPKDQSTNFNGNVVILEFDEDIKLNRLQDQLQISPTTNLNYKPIVKRNRLTLKFDSAFAPNTTYTFLFGDGVVDFNEGNKPQNLKLAFSTGDEIDSLFITGTVTDLLSGKPVKNAMVGLFREKDSSDIDKHKPLYFSLTDSAGRYTIENIKADRYKIYALAENKDKRNFIYDKNEETIGFYNFILPIYQNYAQVDLELVRYDIEPFRVAGGRSRLQYFEIKTNKVFAQYDVDFEDDKYDTLFYPVQEKEYLIFYNKNKNTTDSARAKVVLKDSVENVIDTTMLISFVETKKPRESSFTLREDPPSGTPILPNTDFQLKFVFNKPVLSVAYDSIVLGYKGDSIGVVSTEKDWTFNKNRTELSLIKKITLKTDTAFQIQAKAKTFVSIENDTLTAAKNVEYKQGKITDYGIIKGEVRGEYDHFIIEVLDAKNKSEQVLVNQRKFEFKNLLPGKKKIRVYIDYNKNGIWDRGDFKKRELPEPVVQYGKEIELKANWEIEDVFIDLGKRP